MCYTEPAPTECEGTMETLPTQQQTKGIWAARWGLLLRMARQVAGLSLNELAERSGLSKGYLSKLESAHPSAANPSRATLAALARALPSTLPLIQHIDPAGGLPTPGLLLGGESPKIAGRAMSFPGPGAFLSSSPAISVPETHAGNLPSSWADWEIVLALRILESSGLGPPTLAVLARACGTESVSHEALSRLEQEGWLRRLPPICPGEAIRYTQGSTRLDQFGIQRPADLFTRAAIQLLLNTGTYENERTTPADSSHTTDHAIR